MNYQRLILKEALKRGALKTRVSFRILTTEPKSSKDSGACPFCYVIA